MTREDTQQISVSLARIEESVKALASREYVMQALSEHGRVCPTARAGRSNSVPPASISRMLKIWIPILAAIGAGIAAAMGLGGQ